ncbi:MAG TPA: polysaccharide biosynthesis/export family protein [Pyrinomonadaceae bacterium]|jgi:protein involved in polysaccharide export with SLBB domain
MKKVLNVAATALVCCALEASVLAVQGGKVRVGPSAEDQPPPVSETKSRKPSAATSDAKPEIKIEKSSEARKEPKTDSRTEARREEKSEAAKKSVALTSNVSTVDAGSSSAPASDAPAKKASDAPLPAPAVPSKNSPPASSGNGASGAAHKPAVVSPASISNNNSPAPATSAPASKPAASAVAPSPAASKPSVSNNVSTNVPTNVSPVSPAVVTKPEETKNSSAASTPASTGADAAANSASVAATSAASAALAPTAIYRVGVGDVLDIRLLNQATTRESTLFTVMAGGVLEYPLAGDPTPVAGLTPEEIGAKLAAALKRRAVYEKPQVLVSVRQYESHSVLVSGLVGVPGTKVLRREAVPLYVVIAEAQPHPEAGRAMIISRATGQSTSVDLSDTAALNVLVGAGDVVNVLPRQKEYIYIGGEIASGGQKDFHSGLTLTQAVLAAGGVTRFSSGRIRVARQGADGRLISTEYNLPEIESGKIPDPRLQPGDRIEVARKR